MPPLHRYLGNPVLTGIGRVLFRSPVRDFHCGLRGFRRDAIAALDLQAPGMEFASEMVVRATIGRLRITEVPTTLSRDGRGRPPHLRSWRDGWRHLRFLLLFSPRSVFLYPGALLFCLGLAMMLVLLPGPLRLGPVTLDVHTLFYATTFVVVGFQSMLFWAFSKIHAMNERFLPPDPGFLRVMEKITLEVGLIASAVLLLSGLGASLLALGIWGMGHFGTLSPIETLRIVIPAGTAIIVGVQVAYASFFIGVLRIRSTRSLAADRA